MPRKGKRTLDAATSTGTEIVVSGTTSATPNTATTVAHGEDLAGLTAPQRTAYGKHAFRTVNTSVAASAVGSAPVAILDCDATNITVNSIGASVPFDVVKV